MICALCSGMGSRFTLQCGRQWWPCQPCGGTGARVMSGPAEITLAPAQTKFVRPEPIVSSDSQPVFGIEGRAP